MKKFEKQFKIIKIKRLNSSSLLTGQLAQ